MILAIPQFLRGPEDLEVSGAKIIVNGKSVSYKTNKNGKVTIKFKKAGTYIISAKKKSSGLSVITAPYCVVKVK